MVGQEQGVPPPVRHRLDQRGRILSGRLPTDDHGAVSRRAGSGRAVRQHADQPVVADPSDSEQPGHPGRAPGGVDHDVGLLRTRSPVVDDLHRPPPRSRGNTPPSGRRSASPLRPRRPPPPAPARTGPGRPASPTLPYRTRSPARRLRSCPRDRPVTVRRQPSPASALSSPEPLQHRTGTGGMLRPPSSAVPAPPRARPGGDRAGRARSRWPCRPGHRRPRSTRSMRGPLQLVAAEQCRCDLRRHLAAPGGQRERRPDRPTPPHPRPVARRCARRSSPAPRWRRTWSAWRRGRSPPRAAPGSLPYRGR